MAPSYPAPAIRWMICGAKIPIASDVGMKMMNRILNDFFSRFLNVPNFSSERRDASRGIITPVTAVNTESIIL